MRKLFVGLSMLVFAAPVAACGNDSESPGYEREFRSQYGGKRDLTPPPAPSAEPDGTKNIALLAGIGMAGLIGAGTLTLASGRFPKFAS
jgi:hypothetical protein